jgi:DNA-binding NarL/FixJ family response regulator
MPSPLHSRSPARLDELDALRVLVASPIRFYADGLAQQLARDPGLDVVAVVHAIDELQPAASAASPDVVLLDVAFARPPRVAALATLGALRPAVRVVALAVEEHDDDILDWAEHGVDGLVTRDSTLAEVAAAVRGAWRGELYCSPNVAATLLRRVGALAARYGRGAGAEELTAREHEILCLIDDGLSNKEIAHRLSIEVATVKNHVHHLLEKLGVHRRGEAAAAFARRRNPSR